MTIKQFIEKAIEGGIDIYDYPEVNLEHPCIEDTAPLFLSPKVWQAVGKVEKWDNEIVWKRNSGNVTSTILVEHENKMHEMIYFLVDGKTIEQFIETL